MRNVCDWFEWSPRNAQQQLPQWWKRTRPADETIVERMIVWTIFKIFNARVIRCTCGCVWAYSIYFICEKTTILLCGLFAPICDARMSRRQFQKNRSSQLVEHHSIKTMLYSPPFSGFFCHKTHCYVSNHTVASFSIIT